VRAENENVSETLLVGNENASLVPKFESSKVGLNKNNNRGLFVCELFSYGACP
jgi:hypothetical protein